MRRALALPALVVVLAACVHDGRALRPPDPNQRQTILPATTTTTAKAGALATTTTVPNPSADRMTLALPWADNGAIPAAFTCKGAGTSPAVQWTNVPDGTVELALTVTDDDANGFVHWIIAGVKPDAESIPAGSVPTGTAQALNATGTPGWSGPCPPAGAKHRYRFTLYALSGPSGLIDRADTRTALAQVQQNVLALDVVFGTFTG